MANEDDTVFTYWCNEANRGKPLRERILAVPAGAQCFVVENKTVRPVELTMAGATAYPASKIVDLSPDKASDTEENAAMRKQVMDKLTSLKESLLGPYMKDNVIIQIDVSASPEIDRLETALQMLREESLSLKPIILQAMSMREHGAVPSTLMVTDQEFQHRLESGEMHRRFGKSMTRIPRDNAPSYIWMVKELLTKDGGVDNILHAKFACANKSSSPSAPKAHVALEVTDDNTHGGHDDEPCDNASSNAQQEKGDTVVETKQKGGDMKEGDDADKSSKTSSQEDERSKQSITKPWRYFVSYDGRAMIRTRFGPPAVSWEMTPHEMVQSACGLISAVKPLFDATLAVDHGIQQRDDLPPLWVWDAQTDKTFVNRRALGFLLRLARVMRQDESVKAATYGGISASPETGPVAIEDAVPDEMNSLLAAAFYRSLDSSKEDPVQSDGRETRQDSTGSTQRPRRMLAPYKEMAKLRTKATEKQ